MPMSSISPLNTQSKPSMIPLHKVVFGSMHFIIIRMDEKTNPFTDSRVTLTSSYHSRSDYGPPFLPSLYSSMVVGRAPTQSEVEHKILKEYQKELYQMDEEGHCLAEDIIDAQIVKQQEAKQDFWKKIDAVRSPKSNNNPFLCNSLLDRAKQPPPPKQDNKKLKIRRMVSDDTMEIKTRREQLNMMRQKVERQKKKQNTQKQLKGEKFSLVDMYKIKRQEQIVMKQMKQKAESAQWIKHQVAATFGNFQDFIKESNSSLGGLLRQMDSETQIIRAYPSSIKIRGVTYYSINFMN